MSQLDKIIDFTARLGSVAHHIEKALPVLTELTELTGQEEVFEAKEFFCVLKELMLEHLAFYNDFVNETKNRMPEHMRTVVDTKILAYKNNVPF